MDWSWGLTVGNLLFIWLLGYKKAWVWLLGLVNNFAWVAYSLLTKQYGFIIGSVVITFIQVRNYFAWKKAEECA